jgi:hypothetical protein
MVVPVIAVASLVALLALVGLITSRTVGEPVAVSGQAPSPSASAPPQLPKAGVPFNASRFISDDKGFVGSSARCQGTQSAFAIGRTPGSLVVICGESAGRYEYRGVRLSDDAVLRTNAETDSARGFLAHRAGVVYAVSPTELKVTTGSTVIKREPMIEYREVPR